MEAILLPPKWRDWRIVEVIGEGSFGTVYRAEKNDGVVSSVSAIKVIEITADGTRTAALMRRFRTDEAAREYLWGVVQHCAGEIRTMYRLQGESNLVCIQDHLIEEMEDRVGWRLFIRMEYLQSFNDYQTTHEITQGDIIRMGISLCGALERCEKLNILHRDIKPENIFVSPAGDFKLGDFGVSRVLEATHAQYTSEGTFGYMAPEVYKGQPCGREADIYSLGLVLYTLANKNCEPFIDPEKQLVSYSDLQNAFDKRMKGEALPAPADAGAALAKILLKACAYRPSARYRGAAEFRAALEPLAKAKRRLKLKWIVIAAVATALACAAPLCVPGVRYRLFPRRFAFSVPEGYTADAQNPGLYIERREEKYFSEIMLLEEGRLESEAEMGDALARLMMKAGFSEGEEAPFALRQDDPSVWARRGEYVRPGIGSAWTCELAAIYDGRTGRLVPAALMVYADQPEETIRATFVAFEAMMIAAAQEMDYGAIL